MFMYIYIGVLIFAFGISSILKKNKKDLILPLLLCIFLIILMGGQQKNPDYEIYKNIFNREFYMKDPGFGVINHVLKTIGFSQNNFRIGIAIIGFLLISVTVFKLLDYRAIFFILYFIYPFLFDVVQARNFLSMSILIFSVPLLLKPSKKNKILYVILIRYCCNNSKSCNNIFTFNIY